MLGIVILNYQNWNETLECVKSIMNSSTDEYCICIVDNNSQTSIPTELDNLVSLTDNIVYLPLDSNRGYAYGNNRGWEYLEKNFKIDQLLISNSDIVFCGKSTHEIIEFYKKNNGISFPKILNSEGFVSYIDDYYYDNVSQIYYRIFLKHRFYSRDNAINMDTVEFVQTHLIMGACFAMDRDAIDKLMPLDEETTLYYEEMILSRKADKLNIPIYYNPNSKVVHKEGKSTGKSNPFATMCANESLMYYCRKYMKASKIQMLPVLVYLLIKFEVKSFFVDTFRQYSKENHKRLIKRWQNE